MLERPRYEVLPTEEAERLVTSRLPTEVTVTITSSPRRGIEATLGLAEKLSAGGYTVVPHLAARLVRDQAHLNEILRRLDAIGGRVFVVAGDSEEAAGEFADSLTLLEAIAAGAPKMKEIGVTGYPERHSFIHDDLYEEREERRE